MINFRTQTNDQVELQRSLATIKTAVNKTEKTVKEQVETLGNVQDNIIGILEDLTDVNTTIGEIQAGKQAKLTNPNGNNGSVNPLLPLPNSYDNDEVLRSIISKINTLVTIVNNLISQINAQ